MVEGEVSFYSILGVSPLLLIAKFTLLDSAFCDSHTSPFYHLLTFPKLFHLWIRNTQKFPLAP
jgi:hypothetical protein